MWRFSLLIFLSFGVMTWGEGDLGRSQKVATVMELVTTPVNANGIEDVSPKNLLPVKGKEPWLDKKRSVMDFTELLSSEPKVNVCLTVNSSRGSTRTLSRNGAAAVACVVYAKSLERVKNCAKDNGLDKHDRSLNTLILVQNISVCKESYQPRIICGYRYAALDLSYDKVPVEAKTCFLDTRYVNNSMSQQILRRLAEEKCDFSFERKHWHFSLVTEAHLCKMTHRLDSSNLVDVKTTESLVKVLSGTSLGMELLCMVAMWREIRNKDKIITMLVTVSAGDIVILGSILVRNILSDIDVKGHSCIVITCLNYFGTTLCSLVHMQITFNRFIAVLYPFKVKQLCSWRKTFVTLIVFFLVSVIIAILTSLPEITTDDYEYICDVTLHQMSQMNIYAVTARTVVFVIFVCAPVVLVIVWSICIIVKLIMVNRNRRQLSSNANDLPSTRITLSLLANVVLFLMLIVPYPTMITLGTYFPSLSRAYEHIDYVLPILQCSTGCVNVAIRMIFLEDFRKKFTGAFKAVFSLVRKSRVSE